MEKLLNTEEAKRFYDRFGSRQDSQGYYEDAALTALIEHADFGSATSVFEFGCGTGRFAERLLENHLPPNARYAGVDVSTTMVDLASKRLARFGDRAQVAASTGAVVFGAPDASVDRVVVTYVLDLLSLDDIRQFFTEARRILVPGGRLCSVGLTVGAGGLSHIISSIWGAVHRLSPAVVGGCRPLEVVRLLPGEEWHVLHHEGVVAWSVPSEVLIVQPR